MCISIKNGCSRSSLDPRSSMAVSHYTPAYGGVPLYIVGHRKRVAGHKHVNTKGYHCSLLATGSQWLVVYMCIPKDTILTSLLFFNSSSSALEEVGAVTGMDGFVRDPNEHRLYWEYM